MQSRDIDISILLCRQGEPAGFRYLPEPYEPVSGGISKDGIDEINASGPKALTYDEIMGGIKNGLVIKYFSEKQRGLTVDATVFIEFGKR
jgi:hypothetical protein